MVRCLFCSLPCTTLAKEVQLFTGLGLYSGTFAMYLHLQYQSNKSTGRMPAIFYAICLLFVLSTVDFVSDLAATILDNSISSKDIIFYQLRSRVSA